MLFRCNKKFQFEYLNALLQGQISAKLIEIINKLSISKDNYNLLKDIEKGMISIFQTNHERINEKIIENLFFPFENNNISLKKFLKLFATLIENYQSERIENYCNLLYLNMIKEFEYNKLQ